MQLEGPCPLWGLDDSVCPPRTKDGPLVFFDLKIDPESQTLTQLAAVSQDTQFRARLCPPQSVSLQAGLHGFLAFLRAWRQPVLACRRLWGRRLPALFAALEEAELLEDFLDAVSGLLAVLPLLRERVPAAPRPHLRGLARTYLAREMGAGSALAGAMALRDLCRLLDVGPGARLQPYVHAPRSLHCFAGLQPLVRAAVLGRGDARLLALHQVGLAELRDAHRRDPRAGLLHYGRFLAAPGQPAPGLQALAAYFQAQPAPPPRCTPGPRTCPQS